MYEKGLGCASGGLALRGLSLAVRPPSGFSYPHSTAHPVNPEPVASPSWLSYCQPGLALGCDSCSCLCPVVPLPVHVRWDRPKSMSAQLGYLNPAVCLRPRQAALCWQTGLFRKHQPEEECNLRGLQAKQEFQRREGQAWVSRVGCSWRRNAPQTSIIPSRFLACSPSLPGSAVSNATIRAQIFTLTPLSATNTGHKFTSLPLSWASEEHDARRNRTQRGQSM